MWIDASVIQRAECGSDFRETGGYADCWGYGQSGIRGEGPAQPRRREGGWSSSRKRDESRRECIGAGKEECDEISASTQPIPPLGPTAPTTSRPQPPTLLAKFYSQWIPLTRSSMHSRRRQLCQIHVTHIAFTRALLQVRVRRTPPPAAIRHLRLQSQTTSRSTGGPVSKNVGMGCPGLTLYHSDSSNVVRTCKSSRATLVSTTVSRQL